MDISGLLDSAKEQLERIKTQLTSINVPQTLKSELLKNQDALQRAYDSLLSQAGVYDEGTKQQLSDALASAKKSSLAATAAANKKTLMWIGIAIAGGIILSIAAHIIFKKHKTS